MRNSINRDNNFYPGLQDVMNVPLFDIPAEDKNYEGMEQEVQQRKMQQNIRDSLKYRYEYIKKQQRENMIQRLRLLKKCDDNLDAQAGIIALCKKCPLFRFNMRARTYNPRLQGQECHLQFLTYPYQDQFICDLVDHIENGDGIMFIEKSRDMGFSRLVLGVLTRGRLFRGRSSLIGSYKEGYVHSTGDMDSSFERIFYILDRLPYRMKPQDMIKKYMSVNSKEAGEKEIAGDAGEMFGTGGRRKAIFKDEFAARQFDETALRKTADVSDARIIGGTPEGTDNVYGKIGVKDEKYNHLLIKRLRMHRTDHPLKNTPLWYEYQKATRTSLDLAKEIDISYNDSVTGQVYPHFLTLSRFKPLRYDPGLPTYRSYDFGLDMNVCIWAQVAPKYNTVYIIKAIQKENRDLRKFIGLVKGIPAPGFEYTQEERKFVTSIVGMRGSNGDYGDPYNADNGSTIDKSNTIRVIFEQNGISLETNRESTVASRIRRVTLSLPRIVVNEELTELISAIVQSKYPQKKESHQSTSDDRKPIHNRNSHFRTGLEYLLDNLYKNHILQEITGVIIEPQ